jgi:hypothetical protein
LALDVMLMPQAEKHAGKQVDLTTHRSGARPHNGKQTCSVFHYRHPERLSAFRVFPFRLPSAAKAIIEGKGRFVLTV